MSEENEDLQEKDIFTSRRKKLAVEYARLAYHTEPLESIFESKIWIWKGVHRYLSTHQVRDQAAEELYNEAIRFIIKRWGEFKRTERVMTGGLVMRMVLKHLKKYAAQNGTVLSHPHPERMTKREERERLAKIAEPKLNWKERQMQENLRIDIKDIKEDLQPDERKVLTLKIEDKTHGEIEIRLEGAGFKDVRHRVNKALTEIEQALIKKGYP